MAAASDVPARFDLVLSGGSLSSPVGFVFLDALEPSLPFRTHRAIYGYSPTFIERQNVSGAFGDNQQDFFMTSTQKDWSLGDGLRFAKVNDADAARRFWTGSQVDVTKPGFVSLRQDLRTLSLAAAQQVAGRYGNSVAFATTTNLYTVAFDGTITDRGAHGLGATPTAIAADPFRVYLSTTSGATVGVRKWTGSAYSTWSASGSDALALLNNTLYGYRDTVSTGDLVRYDSAGALTSLYTWKSGDGTIANVSTQLLPFGGKLAILRGGGSAGQAELWIYDGTAPALAARLPQNFTTQGMVESNGTIFIGGDFAEWVNGSAQGYPAIFYYSGGTVGTLWRGNTRAGSADLVAFGNGIVFHDGAAGVVYYYDATLGGSHVIATTGRGGDKNLAAGDQFFVVFDNSTTTASQFPHSANYTTSATVTSSLFDFESSLTKFFRGITLDFDSATDGNFGSADIAYRVNDVDGSYTTLQTGAVSGTEYILTGISGHSISVKVTLNKGTSTSGPVLKRVSVRAAPILTSYRTGEYVLDCTGDGGRSPRELRDRTPNPLSGFESLTQLQIAKASTTPLTVTDRMGSYTGIVESVEAYEEHPGLDDPTRSGEFVVKLIVRGI